MKFFVYLGSKFEFLEEKFFRENQNTHFTFTLYVVYFLDQIMHKKTVKLGRPQMTVLWCTHFAS